MGVPEVFVVGFPQNVRGGEYCLEEGEDEADNH